MRNRLPSLALLGLALLAGGGLWLAARGGRGRVHAAARPMAPAGPAVLAEDRTAELAGALVAAEELAPPAGTAPKPARVAVAAEAKPKPEPEPEPANLVWVEGRVVFPPGTPFGESVKVIARGRKLGRPRAHAAEVAADGAFRVPFARGTTSGRFELEARHLYLDDAPRVALGAGKPVVLEARLGGVLRGRVLPPPDAPDGAQPLVGRRVSLTGSKRTDHGPTLLRSAELDASLSFVFTGLPSDLEYRLSCDPLVYAVCTADKLSVPAGGEAVRDLALQTGTTIAGRVVDAAGAPVPGTAVRARIGGRRGSAMRRQSGSDASGAFVLRGISPGAITLTATAQGFLPFELKLGAVEAAAARSDLVLELDRGLSITGRVRWPDGTPAAGAIVLAQPLQSGHVQKGDASKSDASGCFTVTGLEPGPHRIAASTIRKEQVRSLSKVLGRERLRTVRKTHRATRDSVEAGAAGVELELAPGESTRGVVVDSF